MAKTRRSYEGGALSTTTTSTIAASGTTSFTITAYTGWPYGADPFYVVVEPGTASEEKILVTRTGSTDTTINVASDSERGQDGTSAVSHASGSTVFPVFTAVDADEANELTSSWSAKGDLVSHGSTTFETLTVGTNDELLTADSSTASGLAWKDTLSVASASVSGDLTVDTDTLHVDSVNDRVGIGTTSPSQTLHVNSGTGNVPALFESTDSVSIIQIKDNATTTPPAVAAVGDELRLQTSGSSRVTVDSSGNVGIGTTTPQRLLDIRGASDPEIRLQSTDSSNPAIYFGDQVDVVRSGIRYNTADDRLEVQGYNNNTRLAIDSSGNVGMGTTTPSYKLDVNGDINATGDLRVAGNPVGMVLVKAQTVGSGVSSVTVTGITGFANYLFIFDRIDPSSGALLRIDSADLTSSTGWKSTTLLWQGVATPTVYNLTGDPVCYCGLLDTNKSALRLIVYNPNNTGRTRFESQGVYSTYPFISGGQYDADTTTDQFTFSTSTGTLTGGTIRVYGFSEG